MLSIAIALIDQIKHFHESYAQQGTCPTFRMKQQTSEDCFQIGM